MPRSPALNGAHNNVYYQFAPQNASGTNQNVNISECMNKYEYNIGNINVNP